jgi:hypothetical protein
MRIARAVRCEFQLSWLLAGQATGDGVMPDWLRGE